MKWNSSCPHCGYNYKSVDEVQFHNCNEYNTAEILNLWDKYTEMHKFQDLGAEMGMQPIEQEIKMTREEAKNKILNCTGAFHFSNERTLDILESLGLLHFEEPEKEKTNRLFSVNEPGKGWDGPDKNAVNLATTIAKFGTIRLEECGGGLVLWVGGCIVWKSWEKYYRTGDNVTVINRTSKIPSCGKIT